MIETCFILSYLNITSERQINTIMFNADLENVWTFRTAPKY